MDLTQADKDRIIAEERCRLEAKKQLDLEGHGGCCTGGFRRGGFWRGFLLGVVFSALAALICCHHRHNRWERGCGPGYGQGCHQQQGQWAPDRHYRDADDDK